MSSPRSGKDKASLPPHPPLRAKKANPLPALKAVPAGKCIAGAVEVRPRKRASRSAHLPPAPLDRTLDYAASRDELRGIEPGEIVLAVEQLDGFRKVIRPALDAADARRLSPRPGETKRRGRKPSFHALDYWRLELLRRIIASHSTQDTRDWLTTDKARRTRELLNFHQPREHFGGKARKWMEGVPSDGWMSDFRTRWLPESELADLMTQLERWALTEKMTTLPGMEDECRVLFADGSKLETHAEPPRYDEDGNLWNEWRKDTDGNILKDRHGNPIKRITAPEAGFIPNRGDNPDHSGAGWNIVMVMSSKGTVLAHRNVPIHAGEPTTLREMVPEVGQTLGVLGEPQLRVLSADKAFHSQELRRDLRDIGVLENIHLTSHANTGNTKDDTKARDKKRYKIDKHPNWFINGHRELVCKCEHGKVSRVGQLNQRTGKAIARLKGECKTCGNILITSGLWRLSKNNKYVRALPVPLEQAEVEWNTGNPLTYNDPLSEKYGQARFASQEGAFGSQFTQRFRLLKDKRWFYRQSQVDLEVAAVVTITHALSLERWRRKEARESLPASTALAA